MVNSLKKIVFQSLLLIVLFSLSACKELPTELEETQDFRVANTFSKDFIHKIITGDSEGCLQDILPESLNAEKEEWIKNACKNLNGAKIKKTKILGQFYRTRENLTSGNKFTFYELAYELEFEQGGFGLFTLVVVEQNNRLLIKELDGRLFSVSTTELTKFSFENKTINHYLFIAVMAIIGIFWFASIIVAVISNIPIGKKVLWILLILVLNYYKVSINWLTEEIDHSFFVYGNNFRSFNFFNVPNVGYFKANLYSPWFIFFHIPFGAILFWIRRKNLLKKSESKKITSEKSNDGEFEQTDI